MQQPDPTVSLDPMTTGDPNPASAGSVSAAPALGHRVAAGFAWVGINTLATKFIGILVQLVLGWLLVPEDFGIVASVTAITAIANPSRLLNVNTFLSRRPLENQRWANASVWLTFCSVALGCLVMAALTPVLASRDTNPQLFIRCMALGIAATTIESMVSPFTGIINGRMAFGFITRVAVSIFGVQSLLSVLLAYLHFGPYSILIPALFAAVFRLVLHYRASQVKVRASPQTSMWKEMIVEGGWLSIAQFAFLAISQASYLGLSWFHGKYDTGLYFFAFTIAVQALFLVSSGLSAVLLPAMSHAASDEHRRSMYLTCCRLLLLITAPLCVMQTLAIDPIVRLVFGAKWEPAIGMALLLSIGTLLRIVSFPSQSLFVAEGRLKLYAAWMVAWAIVFFAVVMSVSKFGSPMTLTIAVVVFYSIFDLLTGAKAFALCGQTFAKALATVGAMHIVPLSGSLVAGVVTWFLQRWLATLAIGSQRILLAQLGAIAIVLLLYVPIVQLFARRDSRHVWGIIGRLVLPRIPGGARLRQAIGAKPA